MRYHAFYVRVYWQIPSSMISYDSVLSDWIANRLFDWWRARFRLILLSFYCNFIQKFDFQIEFAIYIISWCRCCFSAFSLHFISVPLSLFLVLYSSRYTATAVSLSVCVSVFFFGAKIVHMCSFCWWFLSVLNCGLFYFFIYFTFLFVITSTYSHIDP